MRKAYLRAFDLPLYILTLHLCPCEGARDAGKIIGYWNLPFLSYSATDPWLADKVTYNTLVRLIGPFNLLAEAMLTLFNYYHVCMAS